MNFSDILYNTCSDSLKLGCFNQCAIVLLPFNAQETGTHYLQVISGIKQEISFEAQSGEPFCIDMRWLNENAEIIFKILDPSRDVVQFSFVKDFSFSFPISDLETILANLTTLNLGANAIEDELSPAGLGTDVGYSVELTQDVSIGGFNDVGIPDGYSFWLKNNSSFDLTLLDNNLATTASMRLLLPNSENIVLSPQGGVLIYRSNLGLWNVAMVDNTTDEDLVGDVYDKFCISTVFMKNVSRGQCDLSYDYLISINIDAR